jgi:hypothetical protein
MKLTMDENSVVISFFAIIILSILGSLYNVRPSTCRHIISYDIQPNVFLFTDTSSLYSRITPHSPAQKALLKMALW